MIHFLLGMVPELTAGLAVTLKLIVCSVPLGVLMGIMVAMSRTYGPRPVRFLSASYQSALRGVPLLVQLFILYYTLPQLGILLSPFAAAVLGFGLCSGAYHSEYLRSALLSIPSSQMEAARALGMKKITAVCRVILPQALRRSLGGCGNEIVSLIKYSSLAYLVTLVDLTGAGKQIAYRSFRFFETFLVVGLIYLALVAVTSSGLRALEYHLDPEHVRSWPLAGRAAWPIRRSRSLAGKEERIES